MSNIDCAVARVLIRQINLDQTSRYRTTKSAVRARLTRLRNTLSTPGRKPTLPPSIENVPGNLEEHGYAIRVAKAFNTHDRFREYMKRVLIPCLRKTAQRPVLVLTYGRRRHHIRLTGVRTADRKGSVRLHYHSATCTSEAKYLVTTWGRVCH